MSSRPTQCSRQRRVWRVALLATALTGGLALLIWTKLRLVTGVPKTAYADPEKDKDAGPKSPDAGPESSKDRVPSAPN